MPNPFRNRATHNKQKKHIGEIRQSQLLTTFGIGSIVDFLHGTAMIAGTDDWDKDDNWEDRKIYNENLQSLLEVEYFLAPKMSDGDRFSKANQDIKAYPFPRKMYCPMCKSIIDISELQNQKDKYKCNQYTKSGKPCNGRLVHSRFILVCDNGHVDDFPYSWWVHKGEKCPSGKNFPRIKMYNVGNRSDTESLFLECEECHQKRTMATVFNENVFEGEHGLKCSGLHPHLDFKKEDCDEVPRARMRAASGNYSPETCSAILLPPWTQKVYSLIQKNYNSLKYMSEEGRTEFIKNELVSRNPSIDLQDFLDAFKRMDTERTHGAKRTMSDIYLDEYNVLCKEAVSDERLVSHRADIPDDFGQYFELITAVDRLVVTKAMRGFKRLGHDTELVPLSRESKKWLPAVELNGEGIFIKFRKEAVDKWFMQNRKRYDELNASLKESPFRYFDRYSPQYVMLHTFAHLLIREISNECGYSVASICEKIYSTFHDKNNEEMMGVLIYLSSPDSDGSLGGLVNVADDTELLDKVLKNMLTEAKWCSADPICASSKHQGFYSLNYAACYACTLLPETSCEFANLLLDRLSVVGSPEEPEIGIMGELAERL